MFGETFLAQIQKRSKEWLEKRYRPAAERFKKRNALKPSPD